MIYRPNAFVRLTAKDMADSEPDLRSVIDAQMREALAGPQPPTIGDARRDGALTADGGWCVEKNAITFRIAREDAIAYGLVEPTPEEAADMAARAEEWRIKHDAAVRHAWETYDSALEVLARVAEPLALKVLDLHKPVQSYGDTKCQGCDAEGFEREAPGWPCRTTQLVAEAYGVDLPNGDDLDLTYDHETDTYRRPE